MEQHFPESPKKEDNLASYTEIFENFLPRISVAFDFHPGFSEIFV